MAAGIVEFANVVDPLGLGSNVICIDEGGLDGGELDMTDIKDATGGFLQGDARTRKSEGTVRYYPNGNLVMSAAGKATIEGTEVVKPGDTKGGFFVLKVVQGSDNEKHKTLDVTARLHINGTHTDKAVA